MAEDRKVGISIILKDKMSSAIKKAGNAVSALAAKAEKLKEALGKIAEAAKPFGVLAAAITGAGAATFMLTKRIANNGDQMIKSAQRLTMTTDAFQKFDHIMNISGTSMKEQRGAMTRFARTARDAANGVKIAEEAFQRLNVDVKNADGSFKTTEQLIFDVSDSFRQMPPTVEKSALMMDLFGRSGAQLAQMMNLGSEGMKELGGEAVRLGGVMEESAAKQSESFVDALTRLKLATGGVARTMGERMQPVFTRAMESMANSVVSLKAAFTPVFQSMMTFMSQTAKAVIPLAGFMGKAFIGLGTTVTLAFKGILLTINGVLAGVVGSINALIIDANKALGLFGMEVETLPNVFADTSAEIVGEMGDIIEASTKSMKAIDDLGDAILGVGTNLTTTTPKLEEARKQTDALGKANKSLTKEELKEIEKKRKAQEDAEQALIDAEARASELAQELKAKHEKQDEDREKKRRKRHDEAMKRLRSESEERLRVAIQETNAIASASESMGNAFVNAYANAEEGQNKVAAGGRAMAAELIDQALATMQKFITMEAAKSAAAAATSAAAFGPFAAAAAATLMFSLVRGFISLGFSSMAEGGLVRGGVQGRDSVPTMLMPGEFVLTKKQTDSLMAAGNNPRIQGGGGGVNISINTAVPPNRAEMKRYIRQNLIPAMRELKSQGMSF